METFSASPRPRWRKSTHSFSNGNCVEVATAVAVAVRDSKLGDASPVLTFTRTEWRRFTSSLKS